MRVCHGSFASRVTKNERLKRAHGTWASDGEPFPFRAKTIPGKQRKGQGYVERARKRMKSLNRSSRCEAKCKNLIVSNILEI